LGSPTGIQPVATRLRRTDAVNEPRIVLLGATAGLFHTILDPLVTAVLVYRFGGYERNPLMRWGLREGPVMFALLQVPVILLTMFAIGGILYCIRASDPRWTGRLGTAAEVLFTLGILWGLWLIGGNILRFLSVYT